MALGLNLPVDIPWKRLCTSDDMMVRNIYDILPRRWRSSLAVFGYEPPQEDQTYEGMTVSYLKVVASVTGFQPDPDEAGLKDRRAYLAWNDPAVIENYEETVSKYYGCYGAVLEVVVTPTGSAEELAKIPFAQYPFFVDFEPKKRELYEIVSETGEMMSRSLENVNVRKGATTTDSHEVLDIFGGASGSFQTGGTGGSLAVQGQWGTRDVNQEEFTNVRTTDSGRETRETFSHTTQLTQMYHQLNSYHLGTNRAVFYMLPRPHIVQAPNTFVNGPRMMEGMQEIFLVVMRPKAIKDICVEAYLETAHIGQEPIYEYETSTGPLSLHMELKAPDPGDPIFSGDDDLTITAEDSETFTPPSGWEVDLERNGGYSIEAESGVGILSKEVVAARDHVVAKGKIRAQFIDNPWPAPNDFIDGRLDMDVTVFVRNKTPRIKDYDQTLWMTGRSVCTCPKPQTGGPSDTSSVVWERPLKNVTDKQIGAAANMTIHEANQLRAEIGRFVLTSLNHPDRYPRGTVKFSDTKFVASTLGKLIRQAGHPDNQPLSSIKGLDAVIKNKVAQTAAKVSRGRLLQMSLNEMSDRFGLTIAEAAKLRRATLGLEGPPPSPKDRWNRPKLVITPPKG